MPPFPGSATHSNAVCTHLFHTCFTRACMYTLITDTFSNNRSRRTFLSTGDRYAPFRAREGLAHLPADEPAQEHDAANEK